MYVFAFQERWKIMKKNIKLNYKICISLKRHLFIHLNTLKTERKKFDQ